MTRRPVFPIILVVVLGGWAGWFSGRQLRQPIPSPLPVEAAALASGATFGREAEPAGAVPADFSAIVERSLPAVVAVRATMIEEEEAGESQGEERRHRGFPWLFGEPERRVGFGTGFIISPHGYVLTNHHVIAGASRVTVELVDGHRYDARIVGTDPSIDLALLKVDGAGSDLPTLPLGDSDALRVGEWVIAIGSPLGLEHSVTVGVVSAKGRSFTIGSTDPAVARFIQTDAAINKGNSGGPLLDAQGRVVGINTAIFRGDMANSLVEGVSFALPINVARDAVEQILGEGRVERGFLGITMNAQPIDEEMREYFGLPDTNGVLITEVLSGLPAAEAGLQPQDVIRAVDGEPVRNNRDLLTKVARKRPGETVELEVFRQGEVKTFTVTLASREAWRQRTRERARQPEPPVPTPSGLGIEVQDLDSAIREHLRLPQEFPGVIVRDVDPASDAAEKGVEPGVIITSANDAPVESTKAWQALLKSLGSGDLLKLELFDPGGSGRRIVVLRVP